MQGILYSAGVNVVPALGGYLFLVVATRLYPSEGVGLAASLFSIVSLLSVAGRLGLDFVLLRDFGSAGPAERARLLDSSLLASGLASAGLAAGAALALPALLPSLSSELSSVPGALLLVLATVLTSWAFLVDAAFLADARSHWGLLRAATASALRVAFVALAAGLLPLWGPFASYAFYFGVSLLLALPWYLSLPRGSPPAARRAVAPSAVAGLALTSLVLSPPLVLAVGAYEFRGPLASAAVFVAVSISALVIALPMGLGAAYLGARQGAARGARRSRRERMMLFGLGGSLAALLGLFLFARLLTFLLSPEVADLAGPLLVPLAAQALPLSVCAPLLNEAYGARRLGWIVGLSAAAQLALGAAAWTLLGRGWALADVAWVPAAGFGVLALVLLPLVHWGPEPQRLEHTMARPEE